MPFKGIIVSLDIILKQLKIVTDEYIQIKNQERQLRFIFNEKSIM